MDVATQIIYKPPVILAGEGGNMRIKKFMAVLMSAALALGVSGAGGIAPAQKASASSFQHLNQGFKSIRVPVSYLSKIGSAPNYTIDSSWLDRIQQVVDMCINNGFYVILNMHGDGYNTIEGGWLLCNGQDQDTIRKKYAACWQQIANRFKDYDGHTILILIP